MDQTAPRERDGREGSDRVAWGGLPPPALVRAWAGLILGALTATLGALVLGEYQFEGWLPVGAGILFGAVVAEVVVEVGRRRTVSVAVATGLLAAGGLLWAGWISAGEGLEPISGGAKVAAALGFVVAAGRTFDRHAWRARRAASPGAGSGP